MEFNEKELFREAVDRWGQTAQMDMCVEECAELIKAINKWKRGKGSLFDLVQEMVDVHLMVEELRYIVDNETLWNEAKQLKLTRLRRRLDGEEDD